MIVVVAVVSCVHVMLEYSIGVMVSVLIVVCSGRVLALCIIFVIVLLLLLHCNLQGQIWNPACRQGLPGQERIAS